MASLKEGDVVVVKATAVTYRTDLPYDYRLWGSTRMRVVDVDVRLTTTVAIDSRPDYEWLMTVQRDSHDDPQEVVMMWPTEDLEPYV